MQLVLLIFVLLHALPFTEAQSVSRILCEQYENATTLSGRYTFLADQWGLDSSGFQCMNVCLRLSLFTLRLQEGNGSNEKKEGNELSLLLI
jgi:hypothetical protein